MMKRLKAGRAMYPLPAPYSLQDLVGGDDTCSPALRPCHGSISGVAPRVRPRRLTTPMGFPLEDLDRKSNAVCRDRSENTEPGCLRLPVGKNIQRLLLESASLERSAASAGDLQGSMTPSHSGCEHHCGSWPGEQTPAPQSPAIQCGGNAVNSVWQRFSAPGTGSFHRAA
jgi:hypothetical protein